MYVCVPTEPHPTLHAKSLLAVRYAVHLVYNKMKDKIRKTWEMLRRNAKCLTKKTVINAQTSSLEPFKFPPPNIYPVFNVKFALSGNKNVII